MSSHVSWSSTSVSVSGVRGGPASVSVKRPAVLTSSRHPLIFPSHWSRQPVEGANDFLQVLKSHKEKLEEGMRELRWKNEEMERERDEAEKERDRMLRCIDQLRAKLTQVTLLQSAGRTTGGPRRA